MFKPGDKVICTTTYVSTGTKPGRMFTRGKIYTIRGYDRATYNFTTVYVEIDDQGSKTNGWGEAFFVPASKLVMLFYFE